MYHSKYLKSISANQGNSEDIIHKSRRHLSLREILKKFRGNPERCEECYDVAISWNFMIYEIVSLRSQ